MHETCASKYPSFGSRKAKKVFEVSRKRKKNKQSRQSVSQIAEEMVETLDKRENPPNPTQESKDWSANNKYATNAKIIQVRTQRFSNNKKLLCKNACSLIEMQSVMP